MSGTWRVTYSMKSGVRDGHGNWAYLFINDGRVEHSEHWTDSSSATVQSTSGRQVYVEATQGDNIELRATIMEDDYYRIYFCAEYIPKM